MISMRDRMLGKFGTLNEQEEADARAYFEGVATRLGTTVDKCVQANDAKLDVLVAQALTEMEQDKPELFAKLHNTVLSEEDEHD